MLDVSGAALDRARARLGADAARVNWIEADVTGQWTSPAMDIWHDRAVFHFLTCADDRERYLAHLLTTLKPLGTAIIGAFALDGPERCSGLPVCRYDAAGLAAELGDGFSLVETVLESHRTPADKIQQFTYSRFVRLA